VKNNRAAKPQRGEESSGKNPAEEKRTLVGRTHLEEEPNGKRKKNRAGKPAANSNSILNN